MTSRCRHRGGRPAGLPAKGPGLLANLHPPFTVAAANVFAGEPANTGPLRYQPRQRVTCLTD
ncbi:hypothetical protein E4L40_16390 [Pseudomonas putida]|nr:hypothetical protein E4L40_16390 [Pseudomonas putida]